MTTTLPTGVAFGVTGQDLTLTCTTGDVSLTQFAFYKDDGEVQALGTSDTYTATDGGNYHCIAANTAGDQKTAATAVISVEFKSKFFPIYHLFDK